MKCSIIELKFHKIFKISFLDIAFTKKINISTFIHEKQSFIRVCIKITNFSVHILATQKYQWSRDICLEMLLFDSKI